MHLLVSPAKINKIVENTKLLAEKLTESHQLSSQPTSHQLAEFVKEGAVGEEEGDGEGEDGGSDAADGHEEHQDKGVEGTQAAKKDTTQQQRHGGETEHGEIGDGG